MATPGSSVTPPNALSKQEAACRRQQHRHIGQDKSRLHKDVSSDHLNDFHDKFDEDGKKIFHYCANFSRWQIYTSHIHGKAETAH